ncbi:MAG: DEAD/DEAH box helicase [Phycisphaerae bacterium]|nr:MAG: DEAD/DEAH box helicase [Phycisphaerae bacterium]
MPLLDAHAPHADVTLAGESLRLLPHRAAAWRDTLLVADTHLGKSESFQSIGVPAPTTVLDETLDRLAEAARAAGASRLLVLGDLLHAPAGLTPGMIDRVAAWRREHPLDLAIVPGNHDRRLHTLADAWRFTIAPDRLDDGPYTFVHDPSPIPERHVIGGHLHPCVRIPNGRFPIKLPCFHLRPGVLVLPAFTAFAAGVPVRRVPHDRVFAVVEHYVIEA